MKVSAIVAMSLNRVIGHKGSLPWHLPEDLKRFRLLTLNHTVIMGRKTFESIGKPLPQRKNFVITRQKEFRPDGVSVFSSLECALTQCETDKEVFIIGGGEIYVQSLGIVQRIYLTLIEKKIEGDAYFPELEESSFIELSSESKYASSTSEKEGLAYRFIVLERKNP